MTTAGFSHGTLSRGQTLGSTEMRLNSLLVLKCADAIGQPETKDGVKGSELELPGSAHISCFSTTQYCTPFHPVHIHSVGSRNHPPIAVINLNLK